MEQHFTGKGSKVTQKFKPIDGEIVDKCPGFFADKLEQTYTDKYINKHGYENVRGGKYVNSKTLKTNCDKKVDSDHRPCGKSDRATWDAAPRHRCRGSAALRADATNVHDPH